MMTDLKEHPGAPELLADEPVDAADSRFARAHQVLLGFLGLTIAIWLLSGFYQVQSGQVAIVERLGQYIATPEGAVLQIQHGLHYHIPWPIDRVNIVSTQQIFTLPVTTFNTSPTQYQDYELYLKRQGYPDEYINAIYDPYLITGDKDVAHVEISVQFHISDPVAWLNSVSHEYTFGYDPTAEGDMRNQLFQQIAQRAMVRQVATMDLQQVVGEGRAELELGMKKSLVSAMQVPDPAKPPGEGEIDLGADIQTATIVDSHVPDAVKPAYLDLNTQRLNAETVQKVAQADAAGYVVAAEGEKSTMIAEATAYKYGAIQAAQGDADRFSQVLEQYENAPELTRWNLFKEASQSVAQSAKRIIFAQPGQPVVVTVDPPGYDASQVQPPH